MRLITRPDFDGVVCAALLMDVHEITEPILWVEPSDIQKGKITAQPGDIIANLPYAQGCSLWFDHHCTNQIDTPFEGEFRITPSAARIIYDYYRSGLKRDYSDLIDQTDKIDTAELTMDEVLYPEKYDYVLLSMTVQGGDSDRDYYNRLVSLLRTGDIESVMADTEVKQKCAETIEENNLFRDVLIRHTKVIGHIAVTDFRSFSEPPRGNRFLIYSLFPETIVHVKIRYEDESRERTIIGAGHSIFNRKCNVNIGLMLSRFEGGGHRGAGSCTFDTEKTAEYLDRIIHILLENKGDD